MVSGPALAVSNRGVPGCGARVRMRGKAGTRTVVHLGVHLTHLGLVGDEIHARDGGEDGRKGSVHRAWVCSVLGCASRLGMPRARVHPNWWSGSAIVIDFSGEIQRFRVKGLPLITPRGSVRKGTRNRNQIRPREIMTIGFPLLWTGVRLLGP